MSVDAIAEQSETTVSGSCQLPLYGFVLGIPFEVSLLMTLLLTTL